MRRDCLGDAVDTNLVGVGQRLPCLQVGDTGDSRGRDPAIHTHLDQHAGEAELVCGSGDQAVELGLVDRCHRGVGLGRLPGLLGLRIVGLRVRHRGRRLVGWGRRGFDLRRVIAVILDDGCVLRRPLAVVVVVATRGRNEAHHDERSGNEPRGSESATSCRASLVVVDRFMSHVSLLSIVGRGRADDEPPTQLLTWRAGDGLRLDVVASVSPAVCSNVRMLGPRAIPLWDIPNPLARGRHVTASGRRRRSGERAVAPTWAEVALLGVTPWTPG